MATDAEVRKAIGKHFAQPGRAAELFLLIETEADRLLARLLRPKRPRSSRPKGVCRQHGLLDCGTCELRRRGKICKHGHKGEMVKATARGRSWMRCLACARERARIAYKTTPKSTMVAHVT
jgi:hypothetical protein